MQIEINTKSDPGWEHSCVLFATKPPLPGEYQTELSDDNLLFLFCRKTRLRANIVRSALTRFDKWWSNTDVNYCRGSFIGLWLFNTALYCSIIWSHADTRDHSLITNCRSRQLQLGSRTPRVPGVSSDLCSFNQLEFCRLGDMTGRALLPDLNERSLC